MNPLRTATAFAPATVANVAVGFDILGFSMDRVGDKVTVTRDDTSKGVSVDRITGVVTEIPRDPSKNTAAVALEAFLREANPGFGLKVSIEKGIPLGSGMGGSAASAVGAVVAANALIETPFHPERLLEFALAGETVASGAAHADNIAPCLYGGLTLVLSLDPLKIVPIPTPAEMMCVLVHPHLKIETRHARSVLKPTILLSEHVRQSAHLAAFITACHRGDLDLFQRSMIDVLIEPQRAELIPGFHEAKNAAIEQGALGFSISGSGPSVFAWTASRNAAERVRMALLRVFESHKIGADSWTAPVMALGARILP
jgi:homoserine kinase